MILPDTDLDIQMVVHLGIGLEVRQVFGEALLDILVLDPDNPLHILLYCTYRPEIEMARYHLDVVAPCMADLLEILEDPLEAIQV